MNKILVYLILINFSLDCANSQNESCVTQAVDNIAEWVMKETPQNKILRKKNTTEIMNFTISRNEDCIVPESLYFSKWVLNGTQNEISPGSRVPDSTVIRAVCNSNVDLRNVTEDVTKCQSGNWTPYYPACLDSHTRDIRLRCSARGGCVIPEQPDNGKWLDEEMGQELTTGFCVKQDLSVTEPCNSDFNYLVNGKFTTIECPKDGILLFANYYCTDQDAKGYASKELCIILKPLLNTKWLILKLSEEFLAGQYVKSDTVVRPSCITNYTKVNANYAFKCRKGKWHEHPWNGHNSRMNVSPAEREYQNYVKWYTLGPNNTRQDILKGIPYLALIGTRAKNENNWFCNGHLISDRFILTTAICASNRSSPLVVRLGIDTTPNVTDFQVVETYVSPAYRPLQVYSDIALMKLSEGVEFSEFIHPALLYAHKVYAPVKARSATWSKSAGKRVDIYLSPKRGRICDSYFKRYLGDDLAEGYVNDVQFCARPSNAPIQPVVRDLCDVLPGGALPIYNYDPALDTYFHRIAGLTTNLKDCSKVKGVMLFTNVSAFVPWIEGIVWPPNELVLKVTN